MQYKYKIDEKEGPLIHGSRLLKQGRLMADIRYIQNSTFDNSDIR